MLFCITCRVCVASKAFEGSTTLIEPWYGSGYNSRKISPDLIALWNSAVPPEDLHLPPVNEFIPTDFSLVSTKCTEEDPAIPVLIKVLVANFMLYCFCCMINQGSTEVL